MKIEKFEDIKAWQIARELVREVYRIINNKEFSKDFGLKDQIRRAAVSIPTNIVYPVKYWCITCMFYKAYKMENFMLDTRKI